MKAETKENPNLYMTANKISEKLKNSITDDDDEKMINRQLAQIELDHTGLKDMQTMSEFTAISKL